MKDFNPEEAFEATAKILFETGAYTVGPRIYVSGIIGGDYIDVSAIQKSPEGWKTIIEYMAEAVKEYTDIGKVDRISGGELRDLLVSIPVAMSLGTPHVMIRKKTKQYGAGGNFAGEIKEGDYVVHIADLLTKGSSFRDIWYPNIRGAGAWVNYHFAVFDRLQGGVETISKLDCENFCLVQRNDEFYKIGIDGWHIDDSDSLEEFRNDPAKWGRDFTRNNPKFIADNIRPNADGKLDIKLVKGEKYIQDPPGLRVLTRGYPELFDEIWPEVLDIIENRGDIKSEVAFTIPFSKAGIIRIKGST